MAGQGSVSWIFKKKGFILVKSETASEDTVMNIALESGAEDMKTEADMYEIKTGTPDFENVKTAIEKAKIKIESAEITMIPANTIKLEGDAAKSVLSLVEALEEH